MSVKVNLLLTFCLIFGSLTFLGNISKHMLCPYLGFFCQLGRAFDFLSCSILVFFFNISVGIGSFCPFFVKGCFFEVHYKIQAFCHVRRFKIQANNPLFLHLFYFIIYYFLSFMLLIIRFLEKTGINATCSKNPFSAIIQQYEL